MEATYRVRLRGTPPGGLPPRVVRGRVAIAGERESLGGHIVQATVGVLRREAGFRVSRPLLESAPDPD